MYINGGTVETHGGCQVFYSRREDGPIIDGRMMTACVRWQVGRVLRSGVSAKTLAPATWKRSRPACSDALPNIIRID